MWMKIISFKDDIDPYNLKCELARKHIKKDEKGQYLF